MQQRNALDSQVAHADSLRDADRNGRPLDAERRQSPPPIDQGIRDENMQKVHDDHGIHRRFGVTGALQDRRHDLEEDREGNHEKNKRRIGE